jgi:hypothetical protein
MGMQKASAVRPPPVLVLVLVLVEYGQDGRCRWWS